MVLLSDEMGKRNNFEGNESMFLNTLDENGWQIFLSKFNQKVEEKVELDDFKEELWDAVVGFGEPVLMATLESKKGAAREIGLLEEREAEYRGLIM